MSENLPLSLFHSVIVFRCWGFGIVEKQLCFFNVWLKTENGEGRKLVDPTQKKKKLV